jgi:hypothetical protein
MPKFTEMSGTEILFVQKYVRALTRDFDLLQVVLQLMHPKEAAISDVVKATNMAVELEKYGNEFDACLRTLDAKHKFVHVKSPEWPPMDTLADLFSFSFFKVVTKTPGAKVAHAGWFSGEPENWAAVFDDPEAPNQQNMLSSLPESFFTDLTKAAKKFFGGASFFSELFGHFHLPPSSNVWPIPEEYDEDYEDDEDEEYP